jgi:transcriptional regulator with XRE-family HTH domain
MTQGATIVAEKPKLRKLRLQAGLSVPELAGKAGVAASTVLLIENEDVGKPRMATMRKLAAALGRGLQEIDWPGDPFGTGSASEGGA